MQIRAIGQLAIAINAQERFFLCQLSNEDMEQCDVREEGEDAIREALEAMHARQDNGWRKVSVTTIEHPSIAHAYLGVVQLQRA